MHAENVGDDHTLFYMLKQAMADYGGSNRWLWRPFCVNISRVGKSMLFHSNIYLSSSTLAGQMFSSQEPQSEIVNVGFDRQSRKAVVFVNNSFLWRDLTTRPINLPTNCSTVVRGEEYNVKCVGPEALLRPDLRAEHRVMVQN